ncbi:hypothetical protein A3B60_00590 [Candidatus Peregrinibacteria bacterium RIFCSPLOWO2_01_FULL_39_12]|nr:MAG: hypothetical protein A3B60_00590 [Candidatus Peregrinibacteria bacterium RIFCSPLOWO2_01_FULL_39_12]
MEEVRLLQPKMALVSINNENSPYVSYSGNLKNCYLLCGSEYDENCYYGFWLYDSRDSADCDYCQKCELCYDCVDCIECYNVNFSQDLNNCTDCDFCYDCTGCKNCFGCIGLRRKQFMINNKPHSQQEYSKRMKELKDNANREKLFETLESMKLQAPHLYTHVLNIENCTGDYVYNSRNSLNCFDVKQLEDCHYCNNSVALKDCLDMSNSYYNSELDYEVMSEMNLYNCNFCVTCFDSQNLDHCELVYNSHDCFGCFSLKHAEYCIFNEKYKKEEYEKKIEQIKKEMLESGEYMKFPVSTYPYEDSNAAMEWPDDPKIC